MPRVLQAVPRLPPTTLPRIASSSLQTDAPPPFAWDSATQAHVRKTPGSVRDCAPTGSANSTTPRRPTRVPLLDFRPSPWSQAHSTPPLPLALNPRPVTLAPPSPSKRPRGAAALRRYGPCPCSRTPSFAPRRCDSPPDPPPSHLAFPSPWIPPFIGLLAVDLIRFCLQYRNANRIVYRVSCTVSCIILISRPPFVPVHIIVIHYRHGHVT